MHTQTLEYQHGPTLLEAYVAHKTDHENPRPAVLVAHDWTGRNEFACQKAEKLAQLGYVGFALDMYGKGIMGQTKDEKTALIQPFMQDRALLQARIQAAFDALKKITNVDTTRIAAMGYCFGGLCVLDLVRAGTDLAGVISVHGLLMAPDLPHQAIKAKVLALHGYADPMVPPEQVAAFADEMTAAHVDWQLHAYGNTLHAFTNPQANDPDFGTVYDKRAATRAWLSTQNFLAEIFA